MHFVIVDRRLRLQLSQEYQNELSIDIANEFVPFVPFVRRQYPDDTPDEQMEALYVKLHALMKMFDRLQPVQKREAGDAANVLLSLIDRMKGDAPLSKRYLWFEAISHSAHGRIALNEGTEESARRAVTHFENALEVHETISDADDIAVAKVSLAIAKSKYEGGSNEEMLETSRELYELRVAERGEESEYTIQAGEYYAIELQRANRCDEARELLMKLLATSKQVLGPDHNVTKEIEFALQEDDCDDDDDNSDDIEARERVTDPLYVSILFVSLLIGMLGMLYDISLQKKN